MARDLTPALKRCRALGLEPSVLGLTKKPSKRTPPNARRKQSEYGLQLREKQKVKFIYGVLERQFHNYYEKAIKLPGVKGENLLCMLETRLDNVVFRLGFGRTRAEARQTVMHGHILVNGKRVDIPSFQVSPNDVISIKEGSRSSAHIKSVLENTSYRVVPRWLESDPSNFTGKVLEAPTRDQLQDIPVNETLIIEHYSR